MPPQHLVPYAQRMMRVVGVAALHLFCDIFHYLTKPRKITYVKLWAFIHNIIMTDMLFVEGIRVVIDFILLIALVVHSVGAR